MFYAQALKVFIIISFIILSLTGHSELGSTSFIQELNLDKKILNSDGTLPALEIPKLLAKAFLEKKIHDPAFSQDSCLKVKSLPVVGSYNTLQLFSIESTCTPKGPLSYIAKEAAHGEKEAIFLKEIEKFPGMSALVTPATPPAGFLNLALPLAYLSYNDNLFRKRYLAIMPYASGRVLCDVVKDFRDAKTADNAERIKKLYKNLGTQLGNFHKSFMKTSEGSGLGKTVLHGDLHCLNIFYDESKGLTTLIDNETIAHFLKDPATPDDDILKLFLGPFSKSEPESRKDLIKNIDLKTWFDVALSHFIEGYAEAFPQASRKQVYQDLKKIFNTDQAFPWLSISADQLQDLRNNYINPIFDKLLAS